MANNQIIDQDDVKKYRWCVIQLVDEAMKGRNLTVITPLNWISFSEDESGAPKVKFCPLPLDANDAVMIEKLARSCAEAPKSWPTYSFRVYAKTDTWSEAENLLMDILEILLREPDLPENCRGDKEDVSDVLSFKRKKSHSENTVTKAEIDDEISTSDKYVLVAQKDLNEIKSIITERLDEVICSFGPRFDLLEQKMEVLTALVAKTKSVEGQGQVLSFSKLLKDYRIKEILYTDFENDSEAYSRPVFYSLESFQKFEDHELFMKNDEFVKVLKDFFKTFTGSDSDLLTALRKIMKNFFKRQLLHSSFVATKKSGTKILLSATKFGSALFETISEIFQGKMTYVIKGNAKTEAIAEEKDIWRSIGYICTTSDDWETGRQEREKAKPLQN